MAVNLREQFTASTPYWLVTISLPSVTIRLASPDPRSGPLQISDAEGRVYTYYPGLLGRGIKITHSLAGRAPSVPLEFRIPRVYGITAPITLSWGEAYVEIAQWFEGTAWEDRRVLLYDRASNIEVGSATESVNMRAMVRTKDLGTILSPETLITSGRWPDVGNDPDDGSVDETIAQNRRAHQSEGKYYGEVIGFPKWVRINIVEDIVEADYSTGQSIEGFKGILCDGYLADPASTRPLWYYATDRRHAVFGRTLQPEHIGSASDAQGREVTVVTCAVSEALDNADKTFHPSSAASTPARHIAYLNEVGSRVVAGDHIRDEADDASYYRLIKNIESGDTGASQYYGVALLDAEYGGLSSQQTARTARIVPTIRDGSSAYVDCSSTGGVLGPRGGVLRQASDVLATYLGRSQGIQVDVDSIRSMDILSEYNIDGVLEEGSTSPLAWVTKEMLPLLPVVPSWEGRGLRFRHIDPTARDYAASLNVGRDGYDGDRLSKRPLLNDDSVINNVTIRYAYKEEARHKGLGADHYRGFIFTASTSDIDPSNTVASNFIVNDRALESQRKYGHRPLTITSKFIEDADTARRIVNQILNRRYKPRWRIKYRLRRKWGWLSANDLIRINDSEMGLSSELVRIVEIEYGREEVAVTVEEMG